MTSKTSNENGSLFNVLPEEKAKRRDEVTQWLLGVMNTMNMTSKRVITYCSTIRLFDYLYSTGQVKDEQMKIAICACLSINLKLHDSMYMEDMGEYIQHLTKNCCKWQEIVKTEMNIITSKQVKRLDMPSAAGLYMLSLQSESALFSDLDLHDDICHLLQDRAMKYEFFDANPLEEFMNLYRALKSQYNIPIPIEVVQDVMESCMSQYT